MDVAIAVDVLVILACLWLLQGMLSQSPLLATLIFVGVIVATLILSVASCGP